MAGPVPLNGTAVGFTARIEFNNRQVTCDTEPTPAWAMLRLPTFCFTWTANSPRSFAGKSLFREDQDRRAGGHSDRDEVGRGVVGKVGIKRDRGGVRSHVSHHDGVAVGRSPHGPRHAGGAARADDTLDDERPAARMLS